MPFIMCGGRCYFWRRIPWLTERPWYGDGSDFGDLPTLMSTQMATLMVKMATLLDQMVTLLPKLVTLLIQMVTFLVKMVALAVFF